jgi:hypothetical protein
VHRSAQSRLAPDVRVIGPGLPTYQYPVPPDLVRALREAGEVIVRSFAAMLAEMGRALGAMERPGARADLGDPCGDGVMSR